MEPSHYKTMLTHVPYTLITTLNTKVEILVQA